MPSIFLPDRQIVQPQDTAEVDYGNPLTAGMTLAVMPGNSGYDFVRGVMPARSGDTRVAALHGVGASFSGAGAKLDFGQNRVIPGGSSTHSVMAVAVWPALGYKPVFTQSILGSPFSQTTLAAGVDALTNSSSGKISFFDFGGSGVVDVSSSVSAQNGAADGKYHAVVAVRNGANSRIYIDGVDKTTTQTGNGNTIDAPTQSLFIGNDINETSPFTAAVLLVVTWARALTPAEAREVTAAPWQLFRTRRRLYFDVPTGAATVSADGVIRWSMLASASVDRALRYSLIEAVQQDAALRWSMLTPASADATVRWSMLQDVQSDTPTRWSMLQGVTTDQALRWSLLAAVNRDASLLWSMLQSAQSDATARWSLIAAINADATLRYSLVQAVQQDAALRWSMLAAVSADVALLWDMAGATGVVSRDFAARWSMLAPVNADASLHWSLLNAVARDVALPWSMVQAIASDRALRWSLIQAVQADADIASSLVQAVSADAVLAWDLAASLGTVGASMSLRWTLIAAVQRSIDVRWSLLQSVGADAEMRWDLLTSLTAELTARWSMIGRAVADAPIRWDLIAASATDLVIRWQVGEVFDLVVRKRFVAGAGMRRSFVV